MRASFVRMIPNIVSLLLFTFVLVLCWNYPPAAKRLLAIAAFLGMILSLVLVLQNLRDWNRADDPGIEKEKGEGRYNFPALSLISSAAWMIGIVPLIYLMGFTLGISLFAFGYYKFHGGSWVISFVLGIIIAGSIYLGFVVGMNVLFPKPILWPSFRA